MLTLTRDFVEFIECCVRREVRFLLVGGYALAVHGHPRATKDLLTNKLATGRSQDVVDA